jgi:hypothetical protein
MAELKARHYSCTKETGDISGEATAKLKCDDSHFSWFPQLPVEIQNQIWRLSLPGPRIVRITPSTDGGLKSICAPPVTLRVTRASRRETLHNGYELAFPTVLQPPRIYFNFSIDVACPSMTGPPLPISWPPTLQCIPFFNEAHRIRKLAFTSTYPPLDIELVAATLLPEFPQLEKIVLVIPAFDHVFDYGAFDPVEASREQIFMLARQATTLKRVMKREKIPRLNAIKIEALFLTTRMLMSWISPTTQAKLNMLADSERALYARLWGLRNGEYNVIADARKRQLDIIGDACNLVFAKEVHAEELVFRRKCKAEQMDYDLVREGWDWDCAEGRFQLSSSVWRAAHEAGREALKLENSAGDSQEGLEYEDEKYICPRDPWTFCERYYNFKV